MIPFKFSNGDTFDLAEGYHEVSTKQFIAMRENPDADFFDRLAMLSGKERELLQNIRDVDFETKLMPQMQWLGEEVDWANLPVPKTVKLGGKDVNVPRELEPLTFGQRIQFFTELRNAFQGEQIKMEAVPKLIAVYLTDATEATGGKYKFTDTEYEATIERAMTLPITQSYPLASFFLTSFLSSWKESDGTSADRRQVSKLKRVWQNLTKTQPVR